MDPRLIPLDSSYLIVVRRNDKTSDDKVPNTLFPPHCFVWRFFDPMSIEIKTRLLRCNIYIYIYIIPSCKMNDTCILFTS